jgi:hypothetical protein
MTTRWLQLRWLRLRSASGVEASGVTFPKEIRLDSAIWFQWNVDFVALASLRRWVKLLCAMKGWKWNLPHLHEFAKSAGKFNLQQEWKAL